MNWDIAETILRRTLKVGLFAGVFFFIIFSVLANIGGNSDALREGLEQFGSENLQRPVSIETLVEMRFFPTMRVHAQGIRVSDSVMNPDPVMEIAEIKVAIPFFNLMLSRQRFDALYLARLYALPGVLDDQEVRIETAQIEGDNFVVSGTRGEESFRKIVALDVKEKKNGKSYRLKDASVLKEFFAMEGAPQ